METTKLLTDDLLDKPNHEFTNTVTYMASMFIGDRRRQLDFDIKLSNGTNLQRGYVWTDKQKSEFIISMLKGIQMPNYYIYLFDDKNMNSTYKVIDGKQRLSTLISFINGEFSINVKGEEYFFDDLHQWLKSRLYSKPLTTVVFYGYEGSEELSDKDLVDIFNYVNFTGTPQDETHIHELYKSLE